MNKKPKNCNNAIPCETPDLKDYYTCPNYLDGNTEVKASFCKTCEKWVEWDGEGEYQ